MLTLAAWNVRSLLDNTQAERPERRTALVARELARYNADIAALSETRFADKGLSLVVATPSSGVDVALKKDRKQVSALL